MGGGGNPVTLGIPWLFHPDEPRKSPEHEDLVEIYC